jgi:DNA-binding MarR family transcriptional regulator/GNAT superfamily N-acetyltransferase
MSEMQVDTVRRFNRLYTQKLGVLDEKVLDSPYSLTSVRVMFELGWRDRPTAREIARDLKLDHGYLSRLLTSLEKAALVSRVPSTEDRRQRLLLLTKKGQRVLAELDKRQCAQVEAMLAELGGADRSRLVASLQMCTSLLSRTPRSASSAPPSPRSPSYVLRDPAPGDLGWIVASHGAMYANEQGWGPWFEGLVASIVADFVAQADPKRERGWIAVRDGMPVGSVLVVAARKIKRPATTSNQNTALLRVLLVDPSARGLGIGTRLVSEAIAFAARAGYRRLELWTSDALHAARRVYERAGFTLSEEEPDLRFGPKGKSQRWALPLG